MRLLRTGSTTDKRCNGRQNNAGPCDISAQGQFGSLAINLPLPILAEQKITISKRTLTPIIILTINRKTCPCMQQAYNTKNPMR